MKNTDLQNRLAEVSALAAKENKGTLGEARMIFDEMTVEAYRQAAIEQEDNKHRSFFVKALLVLALVSAFAAVGVGAYGIYNFPDAPLRQKGEIYTGKRGNPRTKEDYEKFVVWQTALFTSFGTTFFFAFAFGILDSREKRRRQPAI